MNRRRLLAGALGALGVTATGLALGQSDVRAGQYDDYCERLREYQRIVEAFLDTNLPTPEQRTYYEGVLDTIEQWLNFLQSIDYCS